MELLEVTAAAAICSYEYYRYVHMYCNTKVKKPWKKRRWWMTTIHRNNTLQRMNEQIFELLQEPSGEFENFMRMSFSDFEYVLSRVSQRIARQDTQLRKAIPAKVRLAITLRFLSTGDSYKSLYFLFKISSQLISKIIPEVCAAINEVLKDEVKIPSTTEEWLEIEKGFSGKFPHCIGAIDGKHIVIQCPINTGSEYYNYKNTFSVVLLALADSNYRFIFADIGSQGRISDGGVFRNSILWQNICNDNLNLPQPSPLPGSDMDIPYVFVADGAFALNENIMKPYPRNHDTTSAKRIFNQRLASSRVVIENAFGILASKFRVFKKPMLLDPDKASLITMTCVLLHNFLRKSETSMPMYTPAGTTDIYDDNGSLFQPGSWRQNIDSNCCIRPLNQIPRKSSLNARQIREEFTSYFSKQC